MTRTAAITSPSKEKLLAAARTLVLANGFAATSVDDICAQATLTKGSFFHYFKSKDALGRALLECYCAEARAQHDAMFGDHADPLQRVYHYLEAVAKRASDGCNRQGCLIGSLAQELAEGNAAIRTMCAKAFDAWADRLAGELALAKRKRAPRAAFDPEELAEHFVAVMEGAILLCKTQQDCRIVARSVRHFQAYVRSLFRAA